MVQVGYTPRFSLYASYTTLSLRPLIVRINRVETCTLVYNLYVEISTGFTHQGPQARGCVNHVETNTEGYNRLVPWPLQRIHGLATTVSAIKGSIAYLATK